MGILDPVVEQIKRLWGELEKKPVARWGVVAAVSPLTVLIDPGTGDPVEASSAVGAVPLGARVFCLEQNRRVTVIACPTL